MENFTKKPNDFVIANGQTQSVRQFIDTAAKLLNMQIIWQEGIK